MFNLFQVFCVPFAFIIISIWGGGVSKGAITGFVGYLIIPGSMWFGNTEAVENYQLLFVLDSCNSFCHAILQLHNAADKKNAYCLHSNWFVSYPNFANIMYSWRGEC